MDTNPALDVIAGAATLDDLGEIASSADILVLTGGFTRVEIRRTLLDSDADIALLVLRDDPVAFQGYTDLPTRAWGLLPPDATLEELIAAIQALNEGLIVGAPSLMGPALVQRISGPDTDIEPLVEPLTGRETEALQLLSQGLSNKQIAAALHISEHTVKFHVSSIYSKLGATNRAEAVRIGIRQGLVAV
ncbi:MAG: response regulator transcription factor [Anaerolineales bacterium]